MCGIVFFAGPCASKKLSKGLEQLRHRGPDDVGIIEYGHISMGFARLMINGNAEEGHQPYSYDALRGVINGEIYNHQELRKLCSLPESNNDTQVLLPLYQTYGLRFIDKLDGFYSAVIHDKNSNKVVCVRDHMGKKPLFIGRSGTEIFIVSEVKIVERIDWFKSLPKGASEIDLHTGDVLLKAAHRTVSVEAELKELFKASVYKRLPPANLPLGVFLSGGLDSSLVAAIVSRYRRNAVYFTLGETGPDRKSVDLVAQHLNLKDVRTVPLPSLDMLPELIRTIVHVTESYNPSIISNGLATYLLARAAHRAGIKVVLTGEGADELFGGYHYFKETDPWKTTRDKLISDMEFTELRRLDMACMANSVEPRCPFLDRDLHTLSDWLTYSDLYDDEQNKVALRRTHQGLLPDEVLYRRKTSLDVGSGMRGAIVRFLCRNGKTERAALKAIWEERYNLNPSDPYFHAYPVFDQFIDQRGEAHK